MTSQRLLVFVISLAVAAAGIAIVASLGVRPLPGIPLAGAGQLGFSGAYAMRQTAALVTTFPERSDGKPDRAAAAVWLRDQFRALGYETGFQTYSAWADGRYQTDLANVWAVRPGASPETILVMAHYDIPPFVRQGAADDASGVGTILELARVFSRVRTNRTLLFVCTDTEEYAMGGARALVAQAADFQSLSGSASIPGAGPIVAAIGLDYLNIGEMDSLIVEGGGTRRGYTPLWLMTLTREAASRFTPLDPSTILDQWLARSVAVSAKDSGMFLRAGIPAVNLRGLAENAALMKEVYHTPQDTIDRLLPTSFAKWGLSTELIIRSVDAMRVIPSGPEASMTYLDLGNGYYLPASTLQAVLFLFFLPLWAGVGAGWWATAARRRGPAALRVLAGTARRLTVLVAALALGYGALRLAPLAGLLQRFDMYPATSKDPYLYHPNYAVVLGVLALVGVLLFLVRRYTRLLDPARGSWSDRHLAILTLAALLILAIWLQGSGFAAVVFLGLPVYLWLLMPGRERAAGGSRALGVVMSLSGPAVFAVFIFLFGTLYAIGVAWWFVFLGAAYGLFSLAAIATVLIAATLNWEVFALAALGSRETARPADSAYSATAAGQGPVPAR